MPSDPIQVLRFEMEHDPATGTVRLEAVAGLPDGGTVVYEGEGKYTDESQQPVFTLSLHREPIEVGSFGMSVGGPLTATAECKVGELLLTKPMTRVVSKPSTDVIEEQPDAV